MKVKENSSNVKLKTVIISSEFIDRACYRIEKATVSVENDI